MKLKVKDMDIATGGIFVSIVNMNDAQLLDLHAGDRLRVQKNSRHIVTIVDIAESSKAVPPGKIGLFEEVLAKLHAKDDDIVNIFIEEKPKAVYYIKKKLIGVRLTPEEIDEIVEDIVASDLTDIELTYFVAGCFTKGLDMPETIALTNAMVKYGAKLKIDKNVIVDKHCIGGVAGNRTTAVVVPIIAAAGLTMPKTSSRSITSPAGTADTMEVLTDVTISVSKMRKVVQKTNACMVWGGGMNLAAADDKLINVRHPLSLDPEGMLLASIMAKKHAVCSTHVLIDIPVGKGAKIEHVKDAKHLQKQFEKVAKALKMKLKVAITDGSQPIGRGIGPALEARDILWVLLNDPEAPKDLVKKSIEMAGHILEMVGKAKHGFGKRMAKELLVSGKAYKKMFDIIHAQGGPMITDPKKIMLGKYKLDVKSCKSGKISHIDNKLVSKIARVAGAPKDKGAGIYLNYHVGDKVKKGDVLFTIYADSKDKLKYAEEIFQKLCCIIII